MRLKVTASQVVIALVATVLTTQTQAQSPKLKMTTDIPKSITAPDKVETSIGTLEYFDGVPKPKTVETVYDYLDRSRAVQVFLNSIPAMSVATLRDGQASVGADTCNKICIWDILDGFRRRCCSPATPRPCMRSVFSICQKTARR